MKQGTNMKKNIKNLMMLLMLTGLTASHINGAVDNPPSYDEAVAAQQQPGVEAVAESQTQQQPGFFQRARQGAAEKWDAFKGRAGRAGESASQAASRIKAYMKSKIEQLNNFVQIRVMSPIGTTMRDTYKKLNASLAGFNTLLKAKVFTDADQKRLQALVKEFNGKVTALVNSIRKQAGAVVQQQTKAQGGAGAGQEIEMQNMGQEEGAPGIDEPDLR